MTSSQPKRLRFVVSGALLVSLPLSACGEEEPPPIVNTVYVEPPPNPVGETPTMEADGRGVPLPEPVRPEPPTNPAMTEPPPPDLEGDDANEGDDENGGAVGTEGLEAVIGEIRANPVPTPPPRTIRANPGPERREPPE